MKTRGEKIDEFIENVKRIVIKILLILWAVLTIFLAIGFAGNYMEVQRLKEENKKIEREYSEVMGHIETIYVYRN